MLVNRQRYVVLPETEQEVTLLFAVLINAKVNFTGQCIDVFCYTAAGIKGFGIAQVIDQMHKILCGFISICGYAPLNSFPAGPVLSYKKSFSQWKKN